MSIACCSSRKAKRELFWAPDPVVGGRFLMPSGEPFKPSPNAILVLTLRMGFGHLRIAHAMSSWLDEQEAYTYDLLQSQTPETDRLRRYEWFYSKASRIAAASGGPIEWVWDKLLTSGDTSAQCKPFLQLVGHIPLSQLEWPFVPGS